MTVVEVNKMVQKRDKLEARMYKEITKGNYNAADKIRKQIVSLDVEILKAKM